jgi:uncharacterized protein YgiM (DUF1202 family)
MKNSANEITAAAGTGAADSEDRQSEPCPFGPAHSRTEPPLPQPDRLAEKFEAALAAALRGDPSRIAHANPLAVSVGDSSNPGQLDEQQFHDEAATDCGDIREQPALMEKDQAGRPDTVAPISSPIDICAALHPPQLAVASQTSAESDGNWLPGIMHLGQPAGDIKEDSVEWSPESGSPEYGYLQAEHRPNAFLALQQEEGDRVAQNQSYGLASFGDPVALREKTLLGLAALWHRRWEGNLIHRGVLPVAILAGLAGLGALLLMPVVAPGNPPTKTVAEDVPTNPSATGPASREPNDQRWELSEDMVERHTAGQVPQEPITPKLVKTVRISASSDQPTNFLPRAELPPLDAAAGVSSEREGTSATIHTDAELSSIRQGGIDASGREWSESAVRSASPAERVEFGERASAAGDEALVETEPQVAVPGRWPTSMPFEDSGQSTERTSAASEADELELPNSEPALRAAADTGRDTAASEAADLPASNPNEEGPSAEPIRYASVTADVNMRAGPGNNARVVTVIPSGRRVGVIDCAAWCEVTMGGQRGWVHRDFVAGEARSGPARANLVDDRIAAGMPLISADGAPIGTIRGQSIDSTGQEFVVVDLTQELGAAVPSVRLKAEYVAAKNEQARINVTRSRFLSSLPSKSDAEASAVTGAN